MYVLQEKSTLPVFVSSAVVAKDGVNSSNSLGDFSTEEVLSGVDSGGGLGGVLKEAAVTKRLAKMAARRRKAESSPNSSKNKTKRGGNKTPPIPTPETETPTANERRESKYTLFFL